MGRSFLFVLESNVPLAEAEMSLHLAMFAVEGLAGRVRVRMDAHYRVDEDGHAILIDGRNRVGRLVARILAGLLQREFGEGSFQFSRVHQANEQPVSTHKAEEAVA